MHNLPVKLYTVGQIADIVQLSRHRVYEAIRLGLLPAVHIGRQVRIEERAFLDWIQQGGQSFEGGWRRQAV